MTAVFSRVDPARRIASLAGLCSLALIAGALFFQYGVGVKPCEMCHWQRWPHLAAAVAALVIAPLLKTGSRVALMVATAFVLLGLLATYQMGMLNVWQAQLLAAIVAGLFISPAWTGNARRLTWTVIGLIAISGLIGAYQTGMQLHILPGPSSCTGHRFILGSNMVPDVQCDVLTPSQVVFGLSLASYNAIFSLLIAFVAGVLLLKKRA